MQNTKLATALAIAVAVTGSSTGFAAPGANHVLDPVARTTWSPATTLQPAGAPTPGIAMGKVNLKKVTAYNLNLRQGRSTGTKVLATIPKSTAVTVTETSGSWSKTSYRGKAGWVATRYLKGASAAKVAYRWTTANVNVRKGAGTSYASVGVVRANERVTYLRTASGWSNVKTSKGTGWTSNRYLDAHGQHPVAVYGTLRKGQSAYHLLRGRTTSETRTRIANFNMYLKPDQTWWSFIIPSSSSARSVVVERMNIRPASYRATLADLDKWERFDPRKPLADQNYNRKLVTDKDGKRSWAYVGAAKISNYLVKNGIRVTSGDYLRRY